MVPDLFERIRSQYGDVSSWAVWHAAGKTPKSNMGHSQVLNPEVNDVLFETLKVDSVMVALNISRSAERKKEFQNFHDLSPYAQDYKIRFAFENTQYWGSYMTDIIKSLKEKDSNNVKDILRSRPELLAENIAIFREELRFIGSVTPVILAFGATTYDILLNHLRPDEYARLVKLTHYSHYQSKEDFKRDIWRRLGLGGEIAGSGSRAPTTDLETLSEIIERVKFSKTGGEHIDEELLLQLEGQAELLLEELRKG